jgi:hypothetical protein
MCELGPAENSADNSGGYIRVRAGANDALARLGVNWLHYFPPPR